MLCDDCKNNQASVHITQINNNKKTEKHLCEQCAQKSGDLSFSTELKFAGVQDLLKGMFSHGAAPIAPSEAACPNCGMTYSEFSRVGKVGCSQCFGTYGDRIEPILRRIHGTSCHTGKIPKRGGGKLALKQKMKQLKRELEQHIQQEEYEQAARVRDEIKDLEKNLEG